MLFSHVHSFPFVVSVPIGCGCCWLLSRAGLMSLEVFSSGNLGFCFIQGLVPLQGGRGHIQIRCRLSFFGLRPSWSFPFQSRLWVSPWPPGGGLVRFLQMFIVLGMYNFAPFLVLPKVFSDFETLLSFSSKYTHTVCIWSIAGTELLSTTKTGLLYLYPLYVLCTIQNGCS